MPGSSPTMARRDPTMRLNSVDFPTFGRPTMASVGTPAAVVASVLVELYVGWVKMSGNQLLITGNPYYRDSRGLRLPTRVFFSAHPVLSQRKRRIAASILRAGGSSLSRAS